MTNTSIDLTTPSFAITNKLVVSSSPTPSPPLSSSSPNNLNLNLVAVLARAKSKQMEYCEAMIQCANRRQIMMEKQEQLLSAIAAVASTSIYSSTSNSMSNSYSSSSSSSSLFRMKGQQLQQPSSIASSCESTTITTAAAAIIQEKRRLITKKRKRNDDDNLTSHPDFQTLPTVKSSSFSSSTQRQLLSSHSCIDAKSMMRMSSSELSVISKMCRCPKCSYCMDAFYVICSFYRTGNQLLSECKSRKREKEKEKPKVHRKIKDKGNSCPEEDNIDVDKRIMIHNELFWWLNELDKLDY